MGNLTKNFSSDEFKCGCGCGDSYMNSRFVTRLQVFRDVMGIPVSIIKGGGYACKKSSKDKDDIYREGIAAVTKIKKDLLFKAVNIAMSVGFTGIGVKEKNGQIHLHLDDAEGNADKRTRPMMWAN